MKKIILLSAMSLLMFSCANTPAKESISTPVAIGFDMTEGVKITRYFTKSCWRSFLDNSSELEPTTECRANR